MYSKDEEEEEEKITNKEQKIIYIQIHNDYNI